MRRNGIMTGILILLVLPLSVLGQASRDCNWIPSGKIEMGNSEAEARFQYWADSPEIKALALPYAGGPKVSYRGRTVSSEQFTVPVATWRHGPCKGALVIRKVWDTGLPETTFKVKVDDQELADWTIPKDEGPGRWVQLFYVVPESVMAPKDDKGIAGPKGKATVSLKTETATPSYGYAFFITKDWGILGEEFAGSITTGSREWGKMPLVVNYIRAIESVGQGEYERAVEDFERVSQGSSNSALAQLARRMMRLCAYKKVAMAQPKVELSEECFRTHYLLGLYCSANGFWEEALEEFMKAVTADPTHAEATFRLAEAMDYNRLPIEKWAQLMERAGDLWERENYNNIDIFIPIQTEIYEGRTGKFSKGSMDALYRDWKYVEQQVWGASRGMYKLNSRFKVYGADDVKWIWEGWSIHPPEEEWGEWGTYDQSVVTAQYGDSGACGPDVGFRGVGYAQIGPTRGWEVLMHEWNHEFDWTGITGETMPGYPPTHDSDGCGKQPIVNMGCGHRSSMFYYLTPGMYRRQETSDPILHGNHIKTWAIGGLTAFLVPEGLEGEKLGKYFVDEGIYTQGQIDGWKGTWQKQWDENQKKEKPGPMETWEERLMRTFKGYRILNVCSVGNEDEIVAKPGAARFKPYKSTDDFIDLLKVLPDAPEKAIAYAETYVWSPKDQEVRIWLGMNDGMKVWLNGENVHKGGYYSIVNWDDKSLLDTVGNALSLKKGWNHLVVKVDRLGGGWGFSASLVNFDNTPVEGLKYQAKKPRGPIARYERPKVGKKYSWDKVGDDYTKLVPTLSADDLKKFTGLSKFKIAEREFFFDVEAVENSSVIEKPDKNDRKLNNYLNWNWEGLAAVRYRKGGETRDLIFIRPEYYEEYLRLLPGDAAGNVIGTTHYGPNPRRYVLVVDGKIEGDYPVDEQDLLEIKTK